MRIEACSICGTDLRAYRYGSVRINAPRVIGHEVCGKLVSVGRNLEDFPTGQRVTVAPAIGCGSCLPCRRGYSNLCQALKTIGFQFDGGFAHYMEIPAAAFAQGNVNKVPEQISCEEAALAEPTACTLNGQEFLQIGSEDAVAIFGTGFIGCLHAELARIKGASLIIMIGTNKEKAAQAKRLIPDIQLIDPAEGNMEQKMRQLAGKRGIDAVITACSSGQAQIDAVRIAAPRGRISLFGGLSGESTGLLDSNTIHYKELAVYGAHASTPAQNRQALQWISQNKLNVKKYVDAIYTLEDIDRAFREVQSKNMLKAIIKPND
ncbi:MAG: alcohol dehydrogenase catalytic domain-containing protein [Spirochaetaceae bacterium]|nr:MAG: alcohol dehydrogenase catalytic domain-containing protein [Spirochaetaceae bacterium]